MQFIGLAWRNLWRNRRRSIVTISSLAFGFAAIAIFAGYTHAIYTGLGNTAIYAEGVGHLVLNHQAWEVKGRLQPAKYLFTPVEVAKISALVGQELPGATVIPRLGVAGLLSNGVNSSIFIANGIDPEDQQKLLGPFKTQHGILQRDNPSGGIVSAGLAAMLGLKVGSPASVLASTIYGQANALDLDVISVENTGNMATNDKLITLPLAMAQSLVDAAGRADYLTVLLHQQQNSKQVDLLAWAFESEPPSTAEMNRVKVRLDAKMQAAGLKVQIRSWQEMSIFYRQVKSMYDMIFSLILFVVVAIVVLSIANSVSMSVIERTREIGTLRAMGVRRRGVIMLFMVEVFILLFIGIVSGCLLMLVVREAVNASGINYIPPANTVAVPFYIGIDMYRTGAAALLISLLAQIFAFIPAYQSAVRPVVTSLGHV